MSDERKRPRKPTRRDDAPQPSRFSFRKLRARREDQAVEASQDPSAGEKPEYAEPDYAEPDYAEPEYEEPAYEEAEYEDFGLEESELASSDGTDDESMPEEAADEGQAEVLSFFPQSDEPLDEGSDEGYVDEAFDDELEGAAPQDETAEESALTFTLVGDADADDGDDADSALDADDEEFEPDEADGSDEDPAEPEEGEQEGDADPDEGDAEFDEDTWPEEGTLDSDGDAEPDGADVEPDEAADGFDEYADEDQDGLADVEPTGEGEVEGRPGILGMFQVVKDALAEKVSGIRDSDGADQGGEAAPVEAPELRESTATVYRRDTLVERIGELPAARRRAMLSAWGNTVKAFRITLIVGLVIGCVFFLRPAYSKLDARPLREIPEPTWQAISDGTFGEGFAAWYSDTYPFRDQLASLSRALGRLSGIEASTQFLGIVRQGDPIPEDGRVLPGMVVEPEPEADDGADAQDAATDAQPDYSASQLNADIQADILSDLYVRGDSAYSAYYFSAEAAGAYALAVNTAAADLGSRANVYSILVPNSAILLGSDDLSAINASDQRRAINYCYSLYDESVTSVDATSQLLAHKDEYVYFRTDSHWTALGAYYAYCAFCEAKGIEPNSLEDYRMMTFDGFLGSFYATLGSRAMAANPDTVQAWIPMGTNELRYTGADGVEVDWAVIQDVSGWSSTSLYSCFAGGDQLWAEVHNPTIHDGSSCLVVKDPYGNALIPFLVDHYEDVYIADFRYVGDNVADFAAANGVQDVIIINGIEYASHVDAAKRLESIL